MRRAASAVDRSPRATDGDRTDVYRAPGSARSAAPALVALAFTLVPACAPPPASPPPSSADPPAAPLPALLSASAAPPAFAADPPPAHPPPPPPFPPPAFAAPFERTAKPGDGAWVPLVGAAAAAAPALLFRSTVHPDPIKPQVHVALVAIDLQRVELHLVAGTREPLSPAIPEERRPGVVPAADLDRLIAVMNGGFMTRHGQWGMAVGKDTFLPPRDEGCTVAMLADGSVKVRTHTALAGALAEVVAYRQTPPCLLEEREIHPALLGGEKPRRWGMSETGGLDIRRSALGVMPGGRTLVYGLGEWITPRQMAEAMKAAGVVSAAELDVNWSYTRFLLYGEPPAPGRPPEVTATLIPKIKHGARQYVEKPAERDFFYLVKKR